MVKESKFGSTEVLMMANGSMAYKKAKESRSGQTLIPSIWVNGKEE